MYSREEIFIPCPHEWRRKGYFLAKPFIYPLKGGKITSAFGMRSDPFNHRKTFHGGIDIGVPVETPIYFRRGRFLRAGAKDTENWWCSNITMNTPPGTGTYRPLKWKKAMWSSRAISLPFQATPAVPRGLTSILKSAGLTWEPIPWKP